MPQLAHGIAQQASDLYHGDPHAVGQVGGGFALGEGIGLTGKGLQRVAPAAMDMALGMKQAQRLEYPGAAQRLVDEGIIPRGTNVQDALTATERDVSNQALAYDAAHPIAPVDPDTIAQAAHGYAYDEGKIGGLGNVPGPEAADLDSLAQHYLDHNTRTRSMEETIAQKRSNQARASYNNRPNAPTQTNEARNFYGGVARANREAAIALSPELEALLSKEQDLLGALESQKFRDATSTMPTSLNAAKVVLGLKNPTLMGGAAIAADRTGWQVLQGIATPAKVAATLRALMASHDIEPKP